MYRFVTITSLVCLLVQRVASAPASPLRLTIDCTDDRSSKLGSRVRSRAQKYGNTQFDVNTFCNLIHNSIPKTVEDGRFMYDEDLDQTGYADSLMPIAVAPPNEFISRLGVPKLRVPKLRIPHLNVPKLESTYSDSYLAPRLGTSMALPTITHESLEESSAERMESFKKGVQKMLRVVTVLGQIDEYFSERLRIIIDKLSKTFTE